MKNKQFLLIAMLGVATYSFARNGGMDFFILWPKLLYQSNTSPADLPPSESRAGPSSQEYHAPPPPAYRRKKLPNLQSRFYKHTTFLQVSELFQFIRFTPPLLEIDDDNNQKLKKKKKEADHNRKEDKESRVKAAAERQKRGEERIRESFLRFKEKPDLEHEKLQEIVENLHDDGGGTDNRTHSPVISHEHFDAASKNNEERRLQKEAKHRLEMEVEKKERKTKEDERKGKKEEKSRVKAEAERRERGEERRLREENYRLKIQAIKKKREAERKVEAERKKTERKEAKRKEAERRERGEERRLREENYRLKIQAMKKKREAERKGKKEEKNRVKAEAERRRREEERLRENLLRLEEKHHLEHEKLQKIVEALQDDGEEADDRTGSLVISHKHFDTASKTDTLPHSTTQISLEALRNVDTTPLIAIKEFIQTMSETLKEAITLHKSDLWAIKPSMDSIQIGYEHLLVKARISVGECEMQDEENFRKQQFLIPRIQAQTANVASLQIRITEDLPELLKGSFFRLKESLRQRNKALEDKLEESRTEFKAITDQMLRVREEEQSLQDKLLVHKEELEGIESQLTDVEGGIAEIKASSLLVVEELHAPLATRLQFLIKAILESTIQDFWPLFSGSLKEKTGIILPKPPSEKDINEGLSAYLQRLVLSDHNERINNFIDFLDLIRWQGQASVLGIKLNKIVEAKEAFQEGASKRNELVETYTHHKQWYEEIEEKLEEYRLERQYLDIEKERYRSAVTENEREKDTFRKSYQYVLKSEKFLTAPQADELAKILIKIPPCDEKESFNGYILDLGESANELENIRGNLLQDQADLKSLELEAFKIQEAYRQARFTQSEIEQNLQDHEERKNIKKQMVKSFRDAQEELKHLTETLSPLMTNAPETCTLLQYDHVSRKLYEDFQRLEKSFSPEGSLSLLAEPYKQWKDSHKHVFETENLEEKIATRPLAALKNHETLKEIW